MFPGMNSRQAQQMMRKMGIAQQDIPAQQVIIRCDDKQIIIDNPQVAKVNMMGQDTFQISGDVSEASLDQEVSVSEDDIKTVMEQTQVDKTTAEQAIKNHRGDLAEAILSLSNE